MTENELLLGVNIDHVATLRQARGARYPEPIQAALIAQQAGADAITLHLRQDRRHIQDRDVEMLSDILQVRMNLEMAATAEMVGIATRFRPQVCCLAPEKREELTAEGGLDVASNQDAMQDFCSELADSGIRVCLFIDADPRQLDASVAVGAPVVEIHTGHYADAHNERSRKVEFERIVKAVEYGNQLGLQVNAGHGLDYHNTRAIVGIDGIKELNIGHSIISRALFTGLDKAVREMKALMRKS